MGSPLPIVRPLNSSDAQAYKSLRLAALLDSPTAFWSSWEKESEREDEVWERILEATSDSVVLDCFVKGALVGVTGVRREDSIKACHKAVVWGVYVSPDSRGQGLGSMLIGAAVTWARAQEDISLLELGVQTANHAALRLYEAFGFRRVGLNPQFIVIEGVPYDEFTMVLELKETKPASPRRILETVLYAEDLAAAREFYVGILGLEEISFDESRDMFLRCGESVLILFKASRTVIPDSFVPPHGTTGVGHMAFEASPPELESWKERLRQAGVEIVQDRTWSNGARSIYFNDPAGNVLEFATPTLWPFSR